MDGLSRRKLLRLAEMLPDFPKFRRELDGAENRSTVRQEKIEEFRERFANPYVAADRGFVDAVTQPRETRKKLIQALAMLENKRDKNPAKKHGNIPL
jgi:propionyl-CoA carboxylase beta chain